MGRIKNGWSMAKQSWSIIWSDKSLLPFPIFSAIAAILVIASFLSPLLLFPDFSKWLADGLNTENGNQADPVAQAIMLAAAFAFYFINYFIIIFFNTALSACAVTKFRGQDSTVAGGLKVAVERLPQIIGWALLSATVGMALKALSRRAGWIGNMVIALIGVAWTIATYLVVPTLAVEGLGPIAALKRSGKLISASWGESLVGNFGLGLFGLVITLPGIALIFCGVLAAAISPLLMAFTIGLGILYLMGTAVFTSAAKQVFITGLYLYAAEKQVPQGFSAESMQAAFIKK